MKIRVGLVISGLGFLIMVLLMSAIGWAATIYVAPGATGTGTTPGDPTGLQTALDTANSTIGDHQILIQQGTYDAKAATGYKISALNNNADKSITLSGGWDSGYTNQSTDPALTKLDGGGSPTGVRVLELLANGGTGKNKFYLKRLSLENGYTSGTNNGAGINTGVTNSGLLELNVEKCIFKNNKAIGASGGGIYSTVPLEVSETHFESNGANSYGGGVDALYQTPSYTNAIAAKFDRCTFLNNSSAGQGSAIASTVTLTITRSLFEGQTGAGSPIFSAFGGAPNMSVSDSKFYNNRITYWGSAIQFWNTGGEIKNCLFIENRAGNGNDGYGAIASLDNTGTTPKNIKITNCTFFGNRSLTSLNGAGGAIDNRGNNLTIFNSIFWENGPYGIYNRNGNATLDYSDSQSSLGTIIDEGHNLNPANQCFIGGGDYSLGAASPCIDRGTNTPTGITLPQTDYAGNKRILDGKSGRGLVVDIGAYEYDPYPNKLDLPLILKN
jgi:predicted outer membrane repeat protein